MRRLISASILSILAGIFFCFVQVPSMGAQVAVGPVGSYGRKSGNHQNPPSPFAPRLATPRDMVNPHVEDGEPALFYNRLRIPIGSTDNPVGMVSGDFNGDGIPDLATLSGCNLYPACTQASLTILLGKGDGTFNVLADKAIGPYLNSPAILAGDFNGDGKLDLVVTTQQCSSNCGAITVLLGNGDGTFQNALNLLTGTNAPGPISAGDFNGDGKLDIAIAQCTDTQCSLGNVGVLLGKGDGTFQPEVTYPTGIAPIAQGPIAVGDFNGDGKTDIVTVEIYATYGDVDVLYGNGDGTFQPPIKTLAIGGTPYLLTIADFNQDGKLDLVAAECGTNTTACISGYGFVSGYIGVFLGNGDGTFQALPVIADSNYPTALVAADANGDGKPDFSVADELTGTVTVFAGNGDGTFNPGNAYGIGYTSENDVNNLGFQPPVAMFLVDVDQDGKLDLITTNYYDNTVNVSLGTGVGAFQTYTKLNDISWAPQPVVGDFNGDGKLDLAGDPCPGGFIFCFGELLIYLGNGDGTFKPPQVSGPSLQFGSNAIGDFNGDGKLDLVAAETCREAICNLGVLHILLGNGDGTFTEKATYANSAADQVVLVADINGDGVLDLLTSLFTPDNSGSLQMVAFLGNGDGTFQAPVVLAPLSDLSSLELVKDVNGDGKPDLITAGCPDPSCTAGDIGVLLGNGDGTFQKEVDFPTLVSSFSVAIGDLNGDGKPDLVAADGCTPPGQTCGFEVLLGNGDGTFQAGSHYSAAPASGPLALSDMNGDGILDLVLTAQGVPDPTVSVFIGNGDGTFQLDGDYQADGSYGLFLADFNGDGRPDLAATGPAVVGIDDGAGLSILLNNLPGTFRDFSVTASTIKPIGAGQSATSTVTIGSLTGFNSAVSIDCSVSSSQSASVTCSLSPASVTPSPNGTATSTLTVKSTSTSGQLYPLKTPGLRFPFAMWLPVAGLALLGIRRTPGFSHKKKLFGLFLAFVQFAGLGTQLGCGGSSSIGSGGGNGGATSNTYVITITATSGSLKHATIVSLTVQ